MAVRPAIIRVVGDCEAQLARLRSCQEAVMRLFVEYICECWRRKVAVRYLVADMPQNGAKLSGRHGERGQRCIAHSHEVARDLCVVNEKGSC